jgi:hypothetical protein
MCSAVALTGAPASAASGDAGFVYAGTPIYKCAWRACTVLRVTNFDARLPFQCWQDSQTAPYERFFRISGGVGYIRAVQVANPQPILPRC